MSRRGLLLAIVLLLVLDVALVALAVRRTRTPPAADESSLSVAASPAPGPGEEPVTDTEPGAAGTGSATPPAEPSGGLAPSEPDIRLVDVVGGAVLSAVAGTCADGGLELSYWSGDGLAEWVAPADFAVRITLVGQAEAWLVGGDRGGDCDLDFFRTRNGGRDWERSETTDNAWHLLASSDARQLHAPEGVVDSPCGDAVAVDLSGVTTRIAYVLCGDSSLHVTDDGGASWERLSGVAGASAVAFASEKAGYLGVPEASGCAGVSVSATGDGGRTWESVGCVEELGDAPVRLGANDEWVVAAAVSGTALSGDGGVTWGRLG